MTKCPRCGYEETEHSERMEVWPPDDQKTSLCEWIVTDTNILAMLAEAEKALKYQDAVFEYYIDGD